MPLKLPAPDLGTDAQPEPKSVAEAEPELDGMAEALDEAMADDEDSGAADDEADVPALKGWRRELFGDKALALKHGQLALAVDKGRVVTVEKN
jgi:hypothetical protein